MNALTKFKVADEVLYTRTKRFGSGVLDFVVNSKSFTASPRYAGKVTPSRVSLSLLRGLANWPAIRPTLTTGKDEKYCNTAAICKIVLIRLRMESAVAPAKVSAQSPP